MIELLYFVLVFALANEFSGGGLGWRASWRGRPLWYASIALLALLWPVVGAAWAAGMAGSFLLWRTPGWWRAEDMGLVGHTWYRDFAVMTLRGLLFPIYWWACAALGYAEALAMLGLQALLVSAAYLLTLRTGWSLSLAERYSGVIIGVGMYALYGVFDVTA